MSVEELHALIKEADEAGSSGNYALGEQLSNAVLLKLEQPLEITEQNKSSLKAKALVNLATSFFIKGTYQESVQQSMLALKQARLAADKVQEGKALHLAGNSYLHLAEYALALQYYQAALSIFEETGSKSSSAILLGNIGNVYYYLGDYPRALEFYQQALGINEAIDNKTSIGVNFSNIGNVYFFLRDYTNALDFHQKALSYHEKHGNKQSTASCLGNLGSIYAELKDHERALNFYKRSFTLHKEVGDKNGMALSLGNIGNSYRELANHPAALEHLRQAKAICEETGNLRLLCYWLTGLADVLLLADEPDLNQIAVHLEQALVISAQKNLKREESDTRFRLARLYRMKEQWKLADEHFRKHYELDKEINTEEANRQARMLDYRRKIEEGERDRQLKLARLQEQEKILYNILPAQIAGRIADGEKTIADRLENVSVFFSDIVGFTQLSQQFSAEEVVLMLNEIFSEFDRLANKHGLEKIKTFGDAYMAVAGAPTGVEDHAKRTAGFALEVLQTLENYRQRTGKQVEMRIGLHSGTVVAGIIGESKFAYDLWGDAVNTASRMESHGEAGKIHVSNDFRNLLHDSFRFIERGEIEVKGKGKMKTWFLAAAAS